MEIAMVATDKTADQSYRVIGTRPVRPDGTDKVTGRARYGADITLPGMLYGRVLRSPHAHARITNIDPSKALALAGVRAVISYQDLPPHDEETVLDIGEGAADGRWMARNVFARDKVLYKGHAVAAVCATDQHIAEDALALIEVAYEPLQPLLDVREAMDSNAPLLHEDLYTEEVAGYGRGDASNDHPTNIGKHCEFYLGDIVTGFEEADLIIEREFETSMYHQGYLEAHNGTAQWSEDGELTVWNSSQGPFVVRAQLAALLDLPLSKVKVVPMEIGGGFGGKIPVYMEPMAAILSKMTGRPVKMIMTRQEVLEATGPTSGSWVRVKLGAKHNGQIIAADVQLVFESGAFPGSPFTSGARCALGPYDIENIHVEGWDVCVNKPKVAAYRAPGAPQTEFAVESVVDELAEMLERDPMDLRLQNAAREGTRLIDGTPLGVIGNTKVMEELSSSEHYRSELQGQHRGRGVAMGFWGNAGLETSAYASINVDGTINLVVGTVDIGGLRASHSMQLAEALGINYEDIHARVVDTDKVGATSVTGGSRSTFAGGWAMHELAQDLRAQLEERASQIWGVPQSSVIYNTDGTVHGPDDDDGNKRAFSFQELASHLSTSGGMIQAHADVHPTTVGPCFAGHIVDVEVDPDTGKVAILRYTAAQDVGTAIHPSYVEGQLQGGTLQGIGMALTEEYFYDEDGVMRNSSLLDYRMPTALDVPMIDTILVEVPNPGHPYGVRGVGEVPIVPALAAIANAIHNAIGVRMNKLPASPRNILDELLTEED
jgi:xanthine dehydrogenase molybdenum-binding subunit